MVLRGRLRANSNLHLSILCLGHAYSQSKLLPLVLRLNGRLAAVTVPGTCAFDHDLRDSIMKIAKIDGTFRARNYFCPVPLFFSLVGGTIPFSRMYVAIFP